MTISVDRYRKLKADVDDLQRDVSRAEGRLSQTMERLREDFDCDTLKRAEALAKKKGREADEAEEEYDEALEAFETEWKEALGGDDDD